jgi:hypothetical protein
MCEAGHDQRPASAPRRKADGVPQQPAKPGIRVGQALGLTVFLATALFLTAIFITRAGLMFDSLQTAAAAFSTLCAAVAAFLMLIDGADLWLRGRRMGPRTLRNLHAVVFAAVCAALVASLFGGNSLVIPILVPSMIAYLFIARRRPAPAGAAAGGRRGLGVARAASGSPAGTTTAKARQRRGGKKRR